MSFGIFQFRRGTSTQWTSANPVLLSGEIGLETDTKQFKLGDGTTPWSSLAYGGIQGPPGTAATLSTEDIQDAASAMFTSATHDGVSTIYNDSANTLTITNTDKGSNAVTNHVALTDPHTQYYNQTRGDARYSQLSHTHTSSNITDFTESAQDAAATMITSGVHDGISVLYTDSSNNLSINNTDKGSTAVTNHEALVDPHPQYATIQSAVLTATQANNTTTEQTLTGHTFTIPPGKSANITGILIFTSAATTTGAFYGVRVAQGAGANGNAVGSWSSYVNLSSAAAATGLSDGDAFNLAGGTATPTGSGVLGTATTTGNNSAYITCNIKNNSTNANTTVELRFRSETTSAITAQIGTMATCVIG